jgi:DNA mismatch endonuclease (patch repair protein)
MTDAVELCECGFPQSHPVPHDHCYLSSEELTAMVDRVSPGKRSEIMRKIKSVSILERERALPVLREKYRYNSLRLHQALDGLTRQPDYYDGLTGTAIWINGCFWHGCPEHFRPPKTRTGYWQSKIGKNRSRDNLSWLEALDKGYRVHIVWEHEIEEWEKERRRTGL